MAYGCVSTGLQLTHSPRQSSCHYATSGNWPFCSHNEYFYGTIISDSVASRRHIANSWVAEIVAFKIPTLSRAIWSPARNFYLEALLPRFPMDRVATELVAVQQKDLDCLLTSSQYNVHALLRRYFDSSLHCSQKLCIHLNLFKLWQNRQLQSHPTLELPEKKTKSKVAKKCFTQTEEPNIYKHVVLYRIEVFGGRAPVLPSLAPSP